MAISLTFGSTTTATTNASGVATATGMTIGTADAGREVLVGVTSQSTETIASVTIGGKAATQRGSITNTGVSPNLQATIWGASVPTGTTADVVVTLSAATTGIVIGLTTLRLLEGSKANSDLDSLTGSGVSIVLSGVTIPTGGGGIWCWVNDTQTTAVTWTNATEVSDASATAHRHSVATSTTAGTPTVTADGATAQQAIVGIAVALTTNSVGTGTATATATATGASIVAGVGTATAVATATGVAPVATSDTTGTATAIATATVVSSNRIINHSNFENAEWTKNSTADPSFADLTTAPDGTNTAKGLYDSALNDSHGIYIQYSKPASSQLCELSLYAKYAATTQRISIWLSDFTGGQNSHVVADLVNGQVGFLRNNGGFSPPFGKVEAVNNGFYRITLKGFTNANTTVYVGTWLDDGTGSDPVTDLYTGSGSNKVYIWDAYFESGLASAIFNVKGTATAIATAVATGTTADGGSVGTATAIATAVAAGITIEAATGTAATVATASGAGGSAGTATATATATAAGISIVAGAGTATAVATATATGESVGGGSAGTALGTATAAATGRAIEAATATASAVATATATGVSTAAGVGTASAVATASGVGQVGGGSAGTALGTATASGRAPSYVAGTATATATAAATTAVRQSGAGTASAIATASARSPTPGVGTAIATAVASGASSATTNATGTAAAVAAASAVGRAIAGVNGTASAVSIASGVAEIIVLQYLRPDADLATGNWTNEIGTTVLYSSIDDAIANDNDYIKSGDNPTADVARIRLANPGTAPSSPVRVRYRYDKDGEGSVDLTVRLLQGVAVVAAWTHTDINPGFTTTTQTLTAPQVAAITDYTDLRVEFQADAA